MAGVLECRRQEGQAIANIIWARGAALGVDGHIFNQAEHDAEVEGLKHRLGVGFVGVSVELITKCCLPFMQHLGAPCIYQLCTMLTSMSVADVASLSCNTE